MPEIKLARKLSAQKYQKSEKGKLASRLKSKRWRDNNPEKHLYWLARSRALKNDIPFNIEATDVEIPDKCPALGIPLFRGKRHKTDNSPTIDKIIPSLGYVKGNIKVISERANRLKDDMSIEEIDRLSAWLRTETLRVKKDLSGGL
jgi:hypothetical protein